jgi:hypothetical protein
MATSTQVRISAVFWTVFCLALPAWAQTAEPEWAQARNATVPAEKLAWRKQAPNLPNEISLLWGDRDRDGGYGELVKLPPGFDSGLHEHSGDFHGVLVSGTWVHLDEKGNGADTPLGPGSYVRQAGGEMHIDRCVSKEPCVLFHFQYSRADVIWPGRKTSAAPRR